MRVGHVFDQHHFKRFEGMSGVVVDNTTPRAKLNGDDAIIVRLKDGSTRLFHPNELVALEKGSRT